MVWEIALYRYIVADLSDEVPLILLRSLID